MSSQYNPVVATWVHGCSLRHTLDPHPKYMLVAAVYCTVVASPVCTSVDIVYYTKYHLCFIAKENESVGIHYTPYWFV